jgi:hypothetical protein
MAEPRTLTCTGEDAQAYDRAVCYRWVLADASNAVAHRVVRVVVPNSCAGLSLGTNGGRRAVEMIAERFPDPPELWRITLDDRVRSDDGAHELLDVRGRGAP